MKLRLANRTRGTVFTTTLRAATVDVVSAGRRFIDSRSGPATGSGEAITSALSASVAGFSVAYQEDRSSASDPAAGPPGFATVRHPRRALR